MGQKIKKSQISRKLCNFTLNACAQWIAYVLMRMCVNFQLSITLNNYFTVKSVHMIVFLFTAKSDLENLQIIRLFENGLELDTKIFRTDSN